MSKSIPVRSACDPQYQWTLTSIFPAAQLLCQGQRFY